MSSAVGTTCYTLVDMLQMLDLSQKTKYLKKILRCLHFEHPEAEHAPGRPYVLYDKCIYLPFQSMREKLASDRPNQLFLLALYTVQDIHRAQTALRLPFYSHAKFLLT